MDTKSPWLAFEAINTLVAFPAVWREEMGDSFPAFRALCLQPIHYEPLFYPCPNQCGRWRRIIHSNGETATLAVCRCDRSHRANLQLPIEEITALEPNRTKLGRAICQALLLHSKSADIGLPFTSQIGSWSADSVPVFLTIQSDPEVFRHVVSDLAASLDQPFILLAPTSHHLDARGQQHLARVHAGFFSLESTLRLTDHGTLDPLKPPGELFARFTPEPREFDEDSSRKAVALVKALGSKHPNPPDPTTVFDLYCLQGKTISRIASDCECSRGTIRSRLALIRAATGVDPDRFRAGSGHLDKLAAAAADPRARHIHRRRLIDDNAT